MNRSLTRHWLSLLVVTLVVSSSVPAAADPPILEKLFRTKNRQGRAPETCADPAVEELAANLDWLEHNLDSWGSIVAKSPDVWGEARLTKYRQEVENILYKESARFKETLAGASSTRDVALLAASLQLASGGASESGLGAQLNVDVINPTIPDLPERGNFGLIGNDDIFAAEKLQLEPVIRLDQHKRYLDYLNELRRINEGDDASDAPGYAINLVRMPVSILPGSHTTHGYGAELTATATMQLDENLLPNTFRDLVINDLVDQLSLPMTRFLNSDPAKVAQLLATFSTGENQQAFVDEFNQFVKLYPVLLDEPQLYFAIQKRLVNQKQENFAFGNLEFPPVFQFDNISSRICLRYLHVAELKQFEEELAIYRAHVAPLLTAITEIQEMWPIEASNATPADCNGGLKLSSEQCELLTYHVGVLQSYGLDFDKKTGGVFVRVNKKGPTSRESTRPQTPIGGVFVPGNKKEPNAQLTDSADTPESVGAPDAIDINSFNLGSFKVLEQMQSTNRAGQARSMRPMDAASSLGGVTELIASELPTQLDRRRPTERLLSLTGNLSADYKSLYSLTALPASLTRRSTLPFPPSELLKVYGERELGRLALAANDAFRVDVLNRQVVHLTDVQAFTREELNSAYQLLSQPAFENYWLEELNNPRLAGLIRGHHHDELDTYRWHFLQLLPVGVQREPIAVLAWAVFVESILLNEKLNEVIQGSGLIGNCQPGVSLDFCGPNPSVEARETFDSYVSARWPLRIFTIDPLANDQNIAETASIQRQMQFAAAFAVASGEMSARAAINFARRLQRDFATVGLNRTAAGFVHGDNTFGWRFEPRFQTPPVQSNAVVILRDLICGGPSDNALRRQRRIEPGMRECVAMILTPSFVSGITIDTRSNWYCLNRPGLSATSMQELTEQSRSIVAMRRAAEQCVRRPDLYRSGEVDRMLRRVEQLDAELPLQTLHCQLPNSNTLGGFELLSSGTRELAPELLGWYGSPGYQPGVDKQVLFLVGDNFSVHQTKVIAGNKVLEAELLSRQIMQVTLPANVPIVNDVNLQVFPDSEYDGYIDAHVATPYGVSGHMLIPALKAKSPAPDPKVSVKAVPEETPIEVKMVIKQKDGQFSVVGDLIVSRAPIAAITIPTTIDTAKAGLVGKTVDLVLAPTRKTDRLADAVIKNVPISDGTVSIGTPGLIQSLSAKGSLFASLAPYGLWLANNSAHFSASEHAMVQAEGVELDINVSVRSGDAAPAVSAGKITIKLTLVRV